MTQRHTPDVVVIGAGIIGSACAFRIAELGFNVAIVESAPSPATGSTGRSAAGVRVQFSNEANIRLSLESILEYKRFQELFGADSGYRPVGYLLLVPHASWRIHLESVALQRMLGALVDVMDCPSAQSLVPFEIDGLAGATYGPADGVVDPHTITLTYLRLAQSLGASLHLDSEVLRATQSDSTWILHTTSGQFQAPFVVNSSGPWAGEVARRAGLELPVVPSRRDIYLTAPMEAIGTVPLTVDLATGFYLRSEGPRVLFGRSNPDEKPGFSTGVDWSWLPQALDAGLSRFPWLESASLDRKASWWGYYETTPDNNAILGRMPGADGWVNACGFSGHGVQHAASVGRVIAEEIAFGSPRLLSIDTLRLDRFSSTAHRIERNIV